MASNNGKSSSGKSQQKGKVYRGPNAVKHTPPSYTNPPKGNPSKGGRPIP